MKPLPLFLLLFAAIISSQIGAQGSNKKIRVENANSLEYNEQFSEAQVLKGNVVLSHQGAFLYCDSAYLFDKENRLEAFSRVRIESDTVKITGNRLTYNANEKQALITGDVLLTDPGTILTTNVNGTNYTNKSKSSINDNHAIF
jgi:lipopolysaccharide assembly outer membrane protein LptD (OstA)